MLPRLLLSAALGGLLGLGLTPTIAPHLVTPYPVDAQAWQVVSPALDEDLFVATIGRGTHITDGALTMSAHAFYNADIVGARTAAPVASATLTLDEGSDVLWVVMGEAPGVRVLLDTGGKASASAPDRQRIYSTDPTFHLDFQDGRLWVRAGDGPPRDAGGGRPGPLELSCGGEQTRVTAVELRDAQGSLLLSQDFSAWPLPAAATGWGVALGALAGAGLSLIATGWLGLLQGGLLLLLPLAVGLVPAAQWLYLAERLYLSETPAWILARLALGLSLLPLVSLALLRTGWLSVAYQRHRSDRWMLPVWGVAALAAAGAATLGVAGPGRWWCLAGLAVMAVVPWTGWRAGLPAGGWLGRDLPALAAVGVAGWGLGLSLLVGWRWLVLVASVGMLLRRAPRPAADHLLILVLLAPVSAEVLIRSTYLSEVWSSGRLFRELPSEAGWEVAAVAWSDQCRPEAPRQARIAFLGGSSTGGAYQLSTEPEAFFAGRTHQALCGQVGEGVGVFTANYGTGDGNTFTISRTIEQVFAGAAPDLLVLYVGVNDLLTRHHNLTRKQREAALLARSQATRGLATLSGRSRLLTALAMLQQPPGNSVHNVSAVPIPDAEENLHRISTAAAEHGAAVLLMTELISRSQSSMLAGYDPMQAAVAASHDHVHWRSVPAVLGTTDTDALLVDRNHLSREGNQQLGAALAPIVAELLGL